MLSPNSRRSGGRGRGGKLVATLTAALGWLWGCSEAVPEGTASNGDSSPPQLPPLGDPAPDSSPGSQAGSGAQNPAPRVEWQGAVVYGLANLDDDGDDLNDWHDTEVDSEDEWMPLVAPVIAEGQRLELKLLQITASVRIRDQDRMLLESEPEAVAPTYSLTHVDSAKALTIEWADFNARAAPQAELLDPHRAAS